MKRRARESVLWTWFALTFDVSKHAEVVTTGSHHSVASWTILHRSRAFGDFIDTLSDKAFMIPCWISLLHVIPTTGFLRAIQYSTLLGLVLVETASSYYSFKDYFTASGVAVPKVPDGFLEQFVSPSSVTTSQVEKARQTLEVVGTVLYIIPLTRYLGLLLLLLAVPTAYDGVRRKSQSLVAYVNYGSNIFDHYTLRFWMQVKAMGCTKLIVGVSGKQATDNVLNACASSAVDQVIADAPVKADIHFLEKQGIDFCVVAAQSQAKMFTDEVINASRCLEIREDGIARPLTTNTESKEN